MKPDVSTRAFLECVYSYYPRDVAIEDPGYEASEQIKRLRHRLLAAVADSDLWQGFIQQVEESFPGCEVSDQLPPLSGPSYRCEVALPRVESWLERTRGDMVVFRLSALAPVYALYARHWKDDGTERESWTRFPPLPPGFQPLEVKLAALIEATFGATRLPNEVLFTPVPGLHPLRGGNPRRAPWLYELLF